MTSVNKDDRIVHTVISLLSVREAARIRVGMSP